MDEKRYRIYGHGAADAVVLYDQAASAPTSPEIWFRSGWSKPRPAQGLHLGMIFDTLCPTAVRPFGFEGTQTEALQALRRDVATHKLEHILLQIAFDGMSTKDAVRHVRKMRVATLLTRPGVVDRAKETHLISMILAAVQKDHGETGKQRLREILQTAKMKTLEELFFGQG